MNITIEDITLMSMSAAAAGSNDTGVNSIAQGLVCSGKIKIRLIILIGINYFGEMHHCKLPATVGLGYELGVVFSYKGTICINKCTMEWGSYL